MDIDDLKNALETERERADENYDMYLSAEESFREASERITELEEELSKLTYELEDLKGTILVFKTCKIRHDLGVAGQAEEIEELIEEIIELAE